MWGLRKEISKTTERTAVALALYTFLAPKMCVHLDHFSEMFSKHTHLRHSAQRIPIAYIFRSIKGEYFAKWKEHIG